MGWSRAELSLTLVNDRAMAKLNRQTFGRRGPTNVIAFPVDLAGAPSAQRIRSSGKQGKKGRADTGPPPVLGEVVISLETTRRQAEESGWPWEELFDFYLIHGILHLLGYDHDTPERAAAMEAKTWQLLEAVTRNR